MAEKVKIVVLRNDDGNWGRGDTLNQFYVGQQVYVHVVFPIMNLEFSAQGVVQRTSLTHSLVSFEPGTVWEGRTVSAFVVENGWMSDLEGNNS